MCNIYALKSPKQCYNKLREPKNIEKDHKHILPDSVLLRLQYTQNGVDIPSCPC